MKGIDMRQRMSMDRGHIVGNRRGRKLPTNWPLLARKVGPVQAPASVPAVDPPGEGAASREAAGRLGTPLGIVAVAELIGCSPWTVRQTLIPQGLPVFRSAASGKLIFYTSQVVRWIERKQQGGL
jgi:hypothetical protein